MSRTRDRRRVLIPLLLAAWAVVWILVATLCEREPPTPTSEPREREHGGAVPNEPSLIGTSPSAADDAGLQSPPAHDDFATQVRAWLKERPSNWRSATTWKQRSHHLVPGGTVAVTRWLLVTETIDPEVAASARDWFVSAIPHASTELRAEVTQEILQVMLGHRVPESNVLVALEWLRFIGIPLPPGERDLLYEWAVPLKSRDPNLWGCLVDLGIAEPIVRKRLRDSLEHARNDGTLLAWHFSEQTIEALVQDADALPIATQRALDRLDQPSFLYVALTVELHRHRPDYPYVAARLLESRRIPADRFTRLVVLLSKGLGLRDAAPLLRHAGFHLPYLWEHMDASIKELTKEEFVALAASGALVWDLHRDVIIAN